VKWDEDEAPWVEDEASLLGDLSCKQERARIIKRFRPNGLTQFLLCF